MPGQVGEHRARRRHGALRPGPRPCQHTTLPTARSVGFSALPARWMLFPCPLEEQTGSAPGRDLLKPHATEPASDAGLPILDASTRSPRWTAFLPPLGALPGRRAHGKSVGMKGGPALSLPGRGH